MIWGIPEAERGQTGCQGSCVTNSASCTQTYGSSKVLNSQDTQGKAGKACGVVVQPDTLSSFGQGVGRGECFQGKEI